MPKRILDDSLLSSPSLARCSPRAQDAFPRFILLMDDFGCAEANPRVLLGRGWPLRNDVTERDVWGWLEEYVAAGMACLWTEKERRWVHLTGWNGPHGQKPRAEYDPNAPKGTPGRHGSKRKTPPPPPELVAAVLAGARRDHDGKPPGVDREDAAETLNDSVPARETTGNQPGRDRETVVSREFPAPAVPVAVPVPVAGSLSPRARLASPFPPGQDPAPNTTAVLSALWERGITRAAPPSRRSEAMVEATIAAVGVDVAMERAAASYARPGTADPLTYHVEAIRSETKPKRPEVGDLGCEVSPWYTLLTEDEARAYREERLSVAPGLEDAPIGILGPERECADLNDRWRKRVEGRA